MSRTIKEIYSEAIYVRNNYLQITELDSGRTQSKMSILNLMTYVMAVLIYSYETVLDVFQVNVAKLILSRINGTAPWYVTMAYKFQFNTTTGNGDSFGFNPDTFMLEYEIVDPTHCIITKAAYQDFSNDSIILKVCKNNTDGASLGHGMVYMPLAANELTAFKSYIQSIKFVGAKVYCVSLPGDLITLKSNGAAIYYNDEYDTAENILAKIHDSLVAYAKSLEYNSFVYYQSFIDAIQAVENVVSIDAGLVVEVKSYNSINDQYDSPETITGHYRPISGYIGFVDEEGETTINLTNLTLIGTSTL